MKIVVSLEKLKKAIQKNITKGEREFELRKLSYPKAQADATNRYVRNTLEFAEAVEKGKREVPSSFYNLKAVLERGVKWPDSPKEDSDLKDARKLLTKLDLVVGETIELNEKDKDYLRYI